MLCAIHQPQFLPWLGYFAKMDQADRFVFLDNVQFKKNEWQNRNRIKAGDNIIWLTIPVKYRFPQKINEVEINNREKWKKKHLQSIRTFYGRSPGFKYFFPLIEEIYSYETESFSDFVIRGVRMIADYLGITTAISVASELNLDREEEDATSFLIKICKNQNCDEYLSGVGGKNYLDVARFEKENIKLRFQDYRHPDYPQKGEQFVSHLSVIDLLANVKDRALEILRSGN